MGSKTFLMKASIAARLRVLGASYEFPIELSATGPSTSLPCKIFSFGITSSLDGQTPDFRKAAMACAQRKAFLFWPSKSSFSEGRKLFFVGFTGDFFYDIFLQLQFKK